MRGWQISIDSYRGRVNRPMAAGARAAAAGSVILRAEVRGSTQSCFVLLSGNLLEVGLACLGLFVVFSYQLRGISPVPEASDP